MIAVSQMHNLHENARTGCRVSRQQLECKRGRNLDGMLLDSNPDQQRRYSLSPSVFLGGETYLVRSIANANIKVGQLSLHHITKNNLETFLSRSALETLGDFSRHTRIQFHRNNFLRFIQNLGRQVTSTGTDFEDNLLW